ncbi:MAG TPA: hypothetical protein DDY13_07165 [Cytophagales bacterium]|jgi:histidine kinase|nr:hypothetical protein [Cytophagales bacterium]
MPKKAIKSRDQETFMHNLMEASRTLSREIQLDRLLEKMMALVMEHAGAIRGFFLQYEQEKLLIQARGNLRSGIRVLQSKPIGKGTRISTDIVQFVIKHQSSLVIDDATKDPRFTNCAYLNDNNIKSVLCLPIFTKGSLAGVIYLENNRKKKAFTQNILESLKILASQMSISMENALLYENLERKVEERTEALTLQKINLEKAHKELKITQSQLVQSEKMASLGQLTAGIAHEINNPVNFISIGLLGLEKNFEIYKKIFKAYEDLDTSRDFKKQLDEINKIKEEYEFGEVRQYVENLIQDVRMGADRTAEIIKGLRNFSRIDEAIQKNANIHDCIDNTITIVKNQLKDVSLEKHYANDMQSIQCYPGQLNQVFLNIITNAIEALNSALNNGSPKTIRISTKNREKDVTISIKDNGVGMDSKMKKKIFDPFFTTKEVGKGTGLGLAISYGIIEKHKGIIDVISKPDNGTEFIITLPKMI